MDIYSIIMTIIVIVLIFSIKIMYYKIGSLTVTKDKLNDMTVSLASAVTEKSTRINELNESLEHGYGIKAETKVVEVKFDLSDDERETVLNGIMLMIANEKTIDGAKYLLATYDKVAGILSYEQ